MVNFSDGDLKGIFLIFIGLILATTLIVPIADEVFGQSNTITVTNVTVTAPAVNGTLDLTGRELITILEFYNSTNVTQTNYTGNGVDIVSGFGTGGLLSVIMTVNDTGAPLASNQVNISYTANPDGYLSSTSDRAIVALIVLFSALAALVFVIVILYKHGTFGKLVRNS